MHELYMQPAPLLKPQEPKRGFLTRFKENVYKRVETVVEKTGTLIKKMNKTVVEPVVAKLFPPYDADKEWVVKELGNNQLAKNFYNYKLSALNVSSAKVKEFMESLFNFKIFGIENITDLETEDLKALYELTNLGNLQNLTGYEICEKLSNETRLRITSWFQQAYEHELFLKICNSVPDDTGIFCYQSIAKHYIKESAKEVKGKYKKYLFLAKFVIVFLTGHLLISFTTLRMLIVWYNMLCSLNAHIKPVTYQTIDPLSLSCVMFFELLIHVYAFDIKRKVDSVTGFLSFAWTILPISAKQEVSDKLHIDLPNDEKLKYHCWNKTLSVLSGIPRLTESQAGRMLCTYALAQTFKDTVELNIDLRTMAERLSPFPTQKAVYELLTLFRNMDEYMQRKERVYQAKEKEIVKFMELFKAMNSEKRVIFQNLIHLSYITYISILRLKIAFCPNQYHQADKGCFINPAHIGVDDGIIEEVSRNQYIRGKNFLTDAKNLELHIEYLKQEVSKNNVMKHIDFFGLPKNILLNVNHQIKCYTPNTNLNS